MEAKIFLMKGITIYQDYIMGRWKNDIRWSTSNETERRRSNKIWTVYEQREALRWITVFVSVNYL
jgi:hypothetical protein